MPDSEEAYGCLSFVILFILFWALIFGVTIDGRYYAIKCSSDRIQEC